MSTTRQLTGGTNDVNPQWWTLGPVSSAASVAAGGHTSFNFMFYDGPVCGPRYWQNGGYDEKLPPVIWSSGYSTCSDGGLRYPSGAFWTSDTLAYKTPIDRYLKASYWSSEHSGD